VTGSKCSHAQPGSLHKHAAEGNKAHVSPDKKPKVKIERLEKNRGEADGKDEDGESSGDDGCMSPMAAVEAEVREALEAEATVSKVEHARRRQFLQELEQFLVLQFDTVKLTPEGPSDLHVQVGDAIALVYSEGPRVECADTTLKQRVTLAMQRVHTCLYGL
jgi:hypothetical protein